MKLPILDGAHAGDGSDGVALDRVEVDVAVTGAMDDSVALDFARTLADAMGAALWREGEPPPGVVVATGLSQTRRAEARLHVVISGGVARSAWRDPRLRCDLELSDPRERVARRLGELLASTKQEW